MKNINPYLIFNGNCRQAMEFYKKCLGGVLYLSTYAELPGEKVAKQDKDKILHARLTIKTLILMASDAHPGISIQEGNNFFVSINAESVEESEKLFKALGEKGKVDQPLQKTFFAHRFGMLTDQFGIKWMVNLEKAKI